MGRMDTGARVNADGIYAQIVRTGEYKFGDKWTESKCVETVNYLRSKGYYASLMTPGDLAREETALHAMKWLIYFSQISDGCCCLADTGFTETTLGRIMSRCMHFPRVMLTAFHDLMLALMANPEFKHVVSLGYLNSYYDNIIRYADGIGTAECNAFSFSVQFLNRPVVVYDLVYNHQLLQCIMESFEWIMLDAVIVLGKTSLGEHDAVKDYLLPMLESNGTEIPDYSLEMGADVLRYRRFVPILSDFKVTLYTGFIHILESHLCVYSFCLW